MSGYPTMDQYNDAVQHPGTAFSDAVLKSAKIATNGLGLPIALGGGFALTYTAAGQGRKFAIRCFHKEAKGLGARYAHIDKGLRAAGGPYFVGFEYQPTGVLVNGSRFPIVKMDWVEGDTLGSYLEDHYSDKAKIEHLRQQFIELEKFLNSKQLAHGDLQNGNVLVKSDLKLIDYDGMYVPSLPRGQGSELGHKHFQHPLRSAADFGPEVDRFSFIVIDLSLRAIAQKPALFTKFSNGENILFTANDFADPGSSAAFADIKAIPALARDAENFASICTVPLKGIPTFTDFLAGNNIPAAVGVIRQPAIGKDVKKAAAYIGAYDVVNAGDYAATLKQVGNRVELVGMVVKVHVGETRYGKAFCFIFFGNGRELVKLNVWSEGMAKLPSPPSQSWVGTWLSVQGLIDPAYVSPRYGSSLSITVATNSQLRKITESDARHRLEDLPKGGTTPAKSGNAAILAGLGTTVATRPQGGKPRGGAQMPSPQPHLSKNQAILDAMRQKAPIGQSQTPLPKPSSKVPWGWIAIGLVILYLIARGSH